MLDHAKNKLIIKDRSTEDLISVLNFFMFNNFII